SRCPPSMRPASGRASAATPASKSSIASTGSPESDGPFVESLHAEAKIDAANNARAMRMTSRVILIEARSWQRPFAQASAGVTKRTGKRWKVEGAGGRLSTVDCRLSADRDVVLGAEAEEVALRHAQIFGGAADVPVPPCQDVADEGAFEI